MRATSFTKSKLRALGWLVGGLVLIYVFIYLLLSLFGQYRVFGFEGGLGYWGTNCRWAPVGFYDPNHSQDDSFAAFADKKYGLKLGTWGGSPMRESLTWIFDPLWIIDTSCFHTDKYIRMGLQNKPNVHTP